MSRPAKSLRVASVNVNGIRAAYKKEMAAWLQERDVDILCLQEVRAPDKIVRELLDESQWSILHAEAAAKGRAGVLIATRLTPNSNGELLENQPVATRSDIGEEYFADSGRWVEADYTLPNGQSLTVVSAYVHSGEVGTQKQDDKYRFLERMLVRMPELAKHSDHVLIVGDLNVGHTELDIKNWKANQKRAGFLPEERAYFDKFFGEIGYVDVARSLAGEVPGPYTWWSYRGQAFDNNAGWRIDYQMATPALAALASNATVDRAASYDERFSDHAPLVVDYLF
ncbi:MAG: exodeoxyribonuclease III [Rothia sp. (in: high G+C Gram-positive bacteria)]|uniref:exodeoxyribonuclease III n=1 Tax=Rothia sp. (in: high G+C Gram-positive bacteria) TaxID=1885016 RepID=UPI0026E06482|nr:exodeoxyribonuclease III [Rothia sp. (in: high G+C Gram-positive bacteria)]MDO5750242.1 exodeoxyribonuclease III [Rothia sp. (in: high G+C Gram-positive bacteria)]